MQRMLKSDINFINHYHEIDNEGINTADYNYPVRTKWEDGTPAHSKFISHVFETYDISKGEFPFTELRPVAWKSGIKEILWIYQDQSNDLQLLRDKYKIFWWDSWDIGDGTIGQRYGATVKKYDQMNELLDGLKNNPFGRRHIIDLWQKEDLKKPGLPPCAFQTLWTVRGEYLDVELVQRSQDSAAANKINQLQYVALLMMVAQSCGYKPGKFSHNIINYHIYDRHEWFKEEMYKRFNTLSAVRSIIPPEIEIKQPKLILDTDNTDFYKFTIDDFKVVDYAPLPKLDKKIEIAI